MYIHLTYAVLPLVFSLVLIHKGVESYKAMLYSAFLGSALYGVKMFRRAWAAKDAIPVLVPDNEILRKMIMENTVCEKMFGNIVVAPVLRTAYDTLCILFTILIDKVSIAAAVIILFSLVHTITDSGMVEYINRAARRFVTSRRRFLVVFLGLALVFAIDDYLVCTGLAAVIAGIAAGQGISREETAYMTCMLAVGFCTLVPYSSWTPVIREALKSDLPLSTVLGMNLAGIFTLMLVSAVILSGRTGTGAGDRKSAGLLAGVGKNQDRYETLTVDSGKVFGLLIACAAATAAALITVNVLTDGTWSVAAAGAAGCLVLMTGGMYLGLVSGEALMESIRKAWDDTLDLFRLLLCVWMVKDICIELLGLEDCLVRVMEASVIPACLLPAFIYLASAMFAYTTGTAFGAFALFIPLALSMLWNSGDCLRTAGAAAALAGSIQCVNRCGCDVIELTEKALHFDNEKMMKLQRKMMVLEVPVLMISFLASGICAGYGAGAMFFAGVCPLVCFSACYYVHLGNRLQKEKRVPGYSGMPGITDRIQYRTVEYAVYRKSYRKNFVTFHERAKELEDLYMIILIRFRQKAIA